MIVTNIIVKMPQYSVEIKNVRGADVMNLVVTQVL